MSKFIKILMLSCLFVLTYTTICFADPRAYYENTNDSNYSSGTTRYVLAQKSTDIPTYFNRSGFVQTTKTTERCDYYRNRHYVSASAGSGISSTSGSGTYKYGQYVSVGATAQSNYRFSSWSGDCGSSGFWMPDRDIYMTANGTRTAYVLSWASKLSGRGKYLGSGYYVKGETYDGIGGWKRIKYTNTGGATSYASPYEAPGSIAVRPGTTVYLEMGTVGGGDNSGCNWHTGHQDGKGRTLGSSPGRGKKFLSAGWAPDNDYALKKTYDSWSEEKKHHIWNVGVK